MEKRLEKIFMFLVVFMVIMGLVAPIYAQKRPPRRNNPVTVMTRNLYLGADIFKVVEAAQNPDPANGGLDVPMAVAEVFQTVQQTNFPERAEAIADEIQRNRPDLVGLQEVETFYTQSPGDFLVGNPDPATDVAYDYLEILMDALAARGLHYQVAVMVTNADVELPMLTGFVLTDFVGEDPTFDDVRMVDHDVILVNENVSYGNPMAENYSTNLGMDISGTYLEFTRGYVAVDVHVGGFHPTGDVDPDVIGPGRTYRFVSTHLETHGDAGSDFAVIQALQMQELLGVLSSETKPTILVGDFNSPPESTTFVDPDYGLIVPPYLQATAGGYLDAWLLRRKPAEGLTCCFDEYVSDPYAELYERIDLILLRPQFLKIRRVFAKVIDNNNPMDMIPDDGNDLWPSDHAGLIGRIQFSTGGGGGGGIE